jgi:hypothetical protein
VATFGFPGSGTAVEIGTRIAKALDDGLSPIEAARDLVEFARKSRVGRAGDDPEGAAQAFEAEFIDMVRSLVGHLQTPDGRPLPVVLVVDDAHWADDATVAVLDHVIRHAQDEGWPLLLLVSTWDEALEPEVGGNRSERPLAQFVRTVEEREALRSTLELSRIPVAPLDSSMQRRLLDELVPTLERSRHEFLLERASGDLELLEDYCIELANTPQWRDPEGRIAVPDADLRSLPANKAAMARVRLRSAGLELAELLAMGSAQGWKFYGAGTAAMARARGRQRAQVDELLGKADRPFRICAVVLHDILGHAAEFRAYPYYEESRKSFDGMPDRANLLRALATTLREQYQRDRFLPLSAIDRVEVLEDLVQAGRELNLRFDPEWRACLDDCALDLAALQLCLGHLDQARRTAAEVLETAADDSERGQRALGTLCDAAHVTDSTLEDELLERWWRVPEDRRSNDAFLRRARRDIRRGRGDAAVTTLDELLARSTHSERERLLLQLERARALCYSEEADRAPEAVASVRAEAASAGVDDPDFAVRLQHTAYIAAHNLERNDDAAETAKASMDRYERAGVREGFLLSRINLGDARWGRGERLAAARLLRKAHADASRGVFAHPRALAALCLANVIAIDDPAAARALYRQGIGESLRAGWKYDELYGRIYGTLLESELDELDGTALHELSAEASSHGLVYLADIAAGYGAMRDAAHGSRPRGTEVLDRDGAAPLGRVHAAAAVLSARSGDDQAASTALFRALERTQGLKGRPHFVAGVAVDAATSEAERTLARRLAERFDG